MKNIIFIFFVLCKIVTIFSQEKVIELNDDFLKTQYKKNSYSISNQFNGDLLLLFEQQRIFKAYLVDSLYQSKYIANSASVNPMYKNFLGYNIEENTYKIFLSNNQNKKFVVLSFDFSSGFSRIIELDFKIKGEKYIESIIYNNKIHLITITKNSSDINIYTFDHQLKSVKNTIPLKGLKFPPVDNQPAVTSLYDALLQIDDDGFFGLEIGIVKIKSKNANEISFTKNKLYHFNNTMILSFDNYDKETQLCFIDLDTFKSEIKLYNKPAKTEKNFKKDNSYIYDNKLFQIASSNKKMKFTILDLNTNLIIKEYTITKKDSIKFKNTPIIQERHIRQNSKIKEIKNTAKYLRDISYGKIGISVYKHNNKYNITLGGVVEELYMSGSKNLGATGSNFGSTFSYSPKTSIYITCLFSKNFEHIQGSISKNKFDRLHSLESKLKKPKAVNKFEHNYHLHYGFLDKKSKVYKVYLFEEL